MASDAAYYITGTLLLTILGAFGAFFLLVRYL